MALTTKANVLIIAPKLSTASDDLWDMILADVGNTISASVFGSKTEIAARYWVAHQMTVLSDETLANVSGPVTKDKVGDVMREYVRLQKISQEEADYARTQYGRKFLTIRKEILPSFSVVIPGV